MPPVPGLFVRERFLPPTVLNRVRADVESAAGTPAAIQRVSGAALGVADDVRRAWEVELPDDLHDLLTDRINAVRPELATFFHVRLERCDAVAAVRYPPGAYYRTHRDAGRRPDSLNLHRRAVSLVMFVNSGAPQQPASFTGGALRLHEVAAGRGIYDITPVAGTLVAFPSTQLHEVMPVRSGTRVTLVTWLLRPAEADLAAGPPRRHRRR